MRKNNWKIKYRGLGQFENSEESAFFWVEPSIAQNGVYSLDGGFLMRVSIFCLGIEREIDEEGLTKKEIENAKEAVLMEL